ncbi:glycosyltransferase family protein [Cytobacillus firmus]|uniref:glycosyltransferase family protein n=1 Tax=Cytobacillus firmus TaxID=1399 RepID=UPI0024C0F9EC|nr:glycosyltransferase family protein [Cytobacillus firmus]WHY61501.1 glycosyltransferase family protein [Cytobacillus firmus]
MKTIAYYISDYGFGHASRSIAVIRELLKVALDIRIIVCHSYGLSFLRNSLDYKQLSYRELKTDIGYILKENSILPDEERIYKEYKQFISNFNIRISIEEKFLKSNKVDMVISDISPIAFEAANSIGIPSIGISNFTWYTAYENFINSKDLKTFKEAYKNMTCFISLAASKEPQWGIERNINRNFYSREINSQEVARIKNEVNPYSGKYIVFVGIGMKMDLQFLEQLPLWDNPDCVFIVSSNIYIDRPNVIKIPPFYLESQNYIAACDFVITKAGWGTASEAVSSKVPLLIIDRESMQEDQNTIAYLKQYNLCKVIEWNEFKSLKLNNSFIDSVMDIKPRNFHNENEVKKIVQDILLYI